MVAFLDWVWEENASHPTVKIPLILMCSFVAALVCGLFFCFCLCHYRSKRKKKAETQNSEPQMISMNAFPNTSSPSSDPWKSLAFGGEATRFDPELLEERNRSLDDYDGPCTPLVLLHRRSDEFRYDMEIQGRGFRATMEDEKTSGRSGKSSVASKFKEFKRLSGRGSTERDSKAFLGGAKHYKTRLSGKSKSSGSSEKSSSRSRRSALEFRRPGASKRSSRASRNTSDDSKASCEVKNIDDSKKPKGSKRWLCRFKKNADYIKFDEELNKSREEEKDIMTGYVNKAFRGDSSDTESTLHLSLEPLQRIRCSTIAQERSMDGVRTWNSMKKEYEVIQKGGEKRMSKNSGKGVKRLGRDDPGATKKLKTGDNCEVNEGTTREAKAIQKGPERGGTDKAEETCLWKEVIDELKKGKHKKDESKDNQEESTEDKSKNTQGKADDENCKCTKEKGKSAENGGNSESKGKTEGNGTDNKNQDTEREIESLEGTQRRKSRAEKDIILEQLRGLTEGLLADSLAQINSTLVDEKAKVEGGEAETDAEEDSEIGEDVEDILEDGDNERNDNKERKESTERNDYTDRSDNVNRKKYGSDKIDDEEKLKSGGKRDDKTMGDQTNLSGAGEATAANEGLGVSEDDIRRVIATSKIEDLRRRFNEVFFEFPPTSLYPSSSLQQALQYSSVPPTPTFLPIVPPPPRPRPSSLPSTPLPPSEPFTPHLLRFTTPPPFATPTPLDNPKRVMTQSDPPAFPILQSNPPPHHLLPTPLSQSNLSIPTQSNPPIPSQPNIPTSQSNPSTTLIQSNPSTPSQSNPSTSLTQSNPSNPKSNAPTPLTQSNPSTPLTLPGLTLSPTETPNDSPTSVTSKRSSSLDSLDLLISQLPPSDAENPYTLSLGLVPSCDYSSLPSVDPLVSISSFSRPLNPPPFSTPLPRPLYDPLSAPLDLPPTLIPFTPSSYHSFPTRPYSPLASVHSANRPPSSNPLTLPPTTIHLPPSCQPLSILLPPFLSLVHSPSANLSPTSSADSPTTLPSTLPLTDPPTLSPPESKPSSPPPPRLSLPPLSLPVHLSSLLSPSSPPLLPPLIPPSPTPNPRPISWPPGRNKVPSQKAVTGGGSLSEITPGSNVLVEELD